MQPCELVSAVATGQGIALDARLKSNMGDC